MRKLNSKQKTIIDKWLEQNTEIDVLDSQDMDAITTERLEELNDYENLYVDIDRYLSDKLFERNYS